MTGATVLLLADGDEQRCIRIQQAIASDILEVVIVGDEVSAQNKLAELKPRAVLLAIDLPIEKIIGAVRAAHIESSVGVLIAAGDHQGSARARQAGADSIIPLPAPPTEIRLRVAELLAHGGDDPNELAIRCIERCRAEQEARLRLLTHDLRGPVTAMTTALGFMEQSSTPEDRKFLIDSCRDAVTRLLQMIDNLEIQAQLRGEKPPEQGDVLDLSFEVHRIVREMEYVFKLREIEVKLLLADEPVVAAGDRALAHVVLCNAVLNAIEHAPAGSSIQIASRNTPAGPIVEVGDEGPRVTANIASLTFEADSQAALKKRGLRIGRGFSLVAIALAIEAQGGSARLEPLSERGARLTLTWKASTP